MGRIMLPFLKIIHYKGKRFVKILTRKDGYSLIELVMVILLASVAIPGLVGLYTTVITKSHAAEFITIAELLAVEQMEIILAHKGSSAAGFGYANINSGRYSSVNPGAPFTGFTRSVTVQTVNAGAPYEFKLLTVTVNNDMISAVILKSVIMDHSALP